jgi:putative addiction module component (TIGR02574 family)
MSTVEEIIQATKSLPKADQWRVWDELAGSLEPDRDDTEGASDAWRAEIGRRSAEIDAGTCQLISGDEVMAKARAIVGIPQDG